MKTVDKRVRYFHGQLLKVEDFVTEQEYHIDRQERHNRLLHTAGIAEGLDVQADLGASEIKVNPGTALDKEGQQIVLVPQVTIGADKLANHKGKQVWVVIGFGDPQDTDPAQEGLAGNTRCQEMPVIDLVAFTNENEWSGTELRIRLAQLKLDENGKVQYWDATQKLVVDTSIRRDASARIGDLPEVRSLKLKVEDVDPTLYPEFRGGAAQQVDLLGSLQVRDGFFLVAQTLDAARAKEILSHAKTPCLLIGCPEADSLSFYWTDGKGGYFKTKWAGEDL